MSINQLVPGRVVFVKIKYDPWWPAIIWDESDDVPRKVLRQKKPKTILVKYITDDMDEVPFFGWIVNEPKTMLRYEKGLVLAKQSKLKRKMLDAALEVMDEFLEQAPALEESDEQVQIRKPKIQKKRGRKKKRKSTSDIENTRKTTKNKRSTSATRKRKRSSSSKSSPKSKKPKKRKSRGNSDFEAVVVSLKEAIMESNGKAILKNLKLLAKMEITIELLKSELKPGKIVRKLKNSDNKKISVPASKIYAKWTTFFRKHNKKQKKRKTKTNSGNKTKTSKNGKKNRITRKVTPKISKSSKKRISIDRKAVDRFDRIHQNDTKVNTITQPRRDETNDPVYEENYNEDIINHEVDGEPLDPEDLVAVDISHSLELVGDAMVDAVDK